MGVVSAVVWPILGFAAGYGVPEIISLLKKKKQEAERN